MLAQQLPVRRALHQLPLGAYQSGWHGTALQVEAGLVRTMPVTVLDFEGHTYVQATHGASRWGRNLKAAEEVTVVHS